MEQFVDYYAVLGVAADAPQEAIKKAFKQQALQYHPDIYKGDDAEEKTRAILQAYQTLNDPARRHDYDLVRARHVPGSPISAGAGIAEDGETSQTARYIHPVFAAGSPAQIDLSDVTYLLSVIEVRRLAEEGMLRGAKLASTPGNYYCHRCHHRWEAASTPATCPNCKAKDWREYLLLRCQHCHAVFESEQIRNEVGALRYGDGDLCHPYELYPLCPACGEAQWCPAEEERLWHVRDRAMRIAKWRRRFGLS